MRKILVTSFAVYVVAAVLLITDLKDSPEVVMASVPATVTLGELSTQQLSERAEQLMETTTTTSTTTTTTIFQPSTTVVAVDVETKCQEWFPTAISVGWPNDPSVLEKLGRVMWRESRCLHDVISKSGDYGVTQINRTSHKRWVEELFAMPFEESMLDPTLNLRFAYLLWESREETGACGWQPWSNPCN
jgi:hypothetical protein